MPSYSHGTPLLRNALDGLLFTLLGMIPTCDASSFPDNSVRKRRSACSHKTFVLRPGVIARLRDSLLGPYVDAFAASLHQEGYPPYNDPAVSVCR